MIYQNNHAHQDNRNRRDNEPALESSVRIHSSIITARSTGLASRHLLAEPPVTPSVSFLKPLDQMPNNAGLAVGCTGESEMKHGLTFVLLSSTRHLSLLNHLEGATKNVSLAACSNGESLMKHYLTFVLLSLVLVPGTAHADILEDILDVIVDGGNDYDWERVELPGTFCGNGSQYKFFVHDTGSPHLLFFLEGGGACWDYDSCSGRAGVLGAANPNGIADDYMTQFTATYVSPIVNGADPGLPLRSRYDLPTKGWNIVYMPYCTGDVHVGNKKTTYADPRGEQPPLAWNHSGFANSSAAANYAADRFPDVDKLLVTGFSAGGTATSAGYYTVRTAIDPQRGYLLNDSGPLYLAPNADYYSRRLHDTINEAWALDTVFDSLPPNFDPNDFGSINRVVAEEFPDDQLAYTAYTRDYNYSRFSYERFYDANDKEDVLAYWLVDQENLLDELENYHNFSYFIPYERQINDSHCSTIITFIGSHACQKMEKKRRWWEYLEWPWGQSFKCYSEFVPMETFLERFINQDQVIRIYEPENGYNAEDPGMSIVAPLINDAISG